MFCAPVACNNWSRFRPLATDKGGGVIDFVIENEEKIECCGPDGDSCLNPVCWCGIRPDEPKLSAGWSTFSDARRRA